MRQRSPVSSHNRGTPHPRGRGFAAPEYARYFTGWRVRPERRDLRRGSLYSPTEGGLWWESDGMRFPLAPWWRFSEERANFGLKLTTFLRLWARGVPAWDQQTFSRLHNMAVDDAVAFQLRTAVRQSHAKVEKRSGGMVNAGFRILPEDKETIAEIARQTGRDESAIMRAAIEMFVTAYRMHPYAIG